MPAFPFETGDLFLLYADPAETLDGEGRAAGFFGDLAILLHDVAAGRFVALEAAEQFRRHPSVGALCIVFIDDVEKGELALGIGSRLFRHGRLVLDMRAAVKEKS